MTFTNDSNGLNIIAILEIRTNRKAQPNCRNYVKQIRLRDLADRTAKIPAPKNRNRQEIRTVMRLPNFYNRRIFMNSKGKDVADLRHSTLRLRDMQEKIRS